MAVQQPTSLAQEHVTLGHALLTVKDPQFLDGYTAGYLRYCRQDVMQSLSDTSIVALLVGRLHDSMHTTMWQAGYVLGWITAAQGLPRVQHVCKPRRMHYTSSQVIENTRK